jgi:hypothetical protein
MAALADRLSRESTITAEDRSRLDEVQVHRPWGQLGAWLEDPVMNWDLPRLILQDVKTLCEK